MAELFAGKHLFVDDYWIERMHAVRRVLHPPVKRGEAVLRPQRAWEARGVRLGRCWFDEQRGVFRLWYGTTDDRQVGTRIITTDNPPAAVYGTHVCYAESADGLTWERPALGQTEFDGAHDTNILTAESDFGDMGAGVIVDTTEADASKRFKMLCVERRPAAAGSAGGEPARVYTWAHSGDGVRWRRSGLEIVPNERLFGVMRFVEEAPHGPVNPDARYLFYGQRGSPWATRQVGRRDSEDLVRWSPNRPIVESRPSDPAGLEFYGLDAPAVNTTYAGLHLGMLYAYYTDLSEPYHPTRNEGLVETLLAFSRDSLRWERWHEPFVPRGPAGAFDAGMVFAQYPLIRDGKLYFFYTAYPGTHASDLPGASIGLATLRLDGFVSVEPEGYMPGTLVTRPRRWKHRSISINADASAVPRGSEIPGEIRAQLQDETGKPFEGFAVADSEPVRADGPDLPLRWRGGEDTAALEGRMVALQFRLGPGTRLYSYALA